MPGVHQSMKSGMFYTVPYGSQVQENNLIRTINKCVPVFPKKVKGAMGLTTQKNYRLLIYGNTLLIVFLGAVIAGGVLYWLLPGDLGESYSVIMATAREIRKVLIWRTAWA